jgi:hypothetical protein
VERPLVAAAGRIARFVRAYATVGAVAALAIGAFLLRDGLPDGAEETTLVVIGIALAAAPPVVLWLLSEALRALAELPGRVRGLLVESRGRREELRRLAETARRLRGARLAALPVLIWRLGRFAGSSRELMRPYAGALPLLSPQFLAFSGLAAAAVAVEIGVGAVLILLLAAA